MFPCTALTECSLYWKHTVFSGRYKVNCIRGAKSGNIKTQCSFGDRGGLDRKLLPLIFGLQR